MNEKDKIIKNEMYNPSDNTLVEERLRAKMLCHNYNNLSPEKTSEKKEIIKQLLGTTCKNYTIEPNIVCDYGYNIEIGENFYSNHNLVLLDPAKIIFGDNVFLGPNCGFYTAEHPINSQERNKGLEYAKPIIVGNNVWFGGSVTVIGGVNIGNNVVIGAGSVIVKDIPDKTVAVGNPCKVIKQI